MSFFEQRLSICLTKIILFPDVLSGRVDGLNKSEDPLFHWATLDRDESDADTETDEDDGKRVLEEERKWEAVGENAKHNKNGETAKLLDSHVADETEAVVTDVLW